MQVKTRWLTAMSENYTLLSTLVSLANESFCLSVSPVCGEYVKLVFIAWISSRGPVLLPLKCSFCHVATPHNKVAHLFNINLWLWFDEGWSTRQ